MTTIGRWPSDDIASVPDVALVRKSDIDAFLDFMQRGDIARPARVYQIQPNGYGLEPYIARYVAKGLDNCDIVGEAAIEPMLIAAWRGLLQSLATWNTNSYRTCAATVRSLAVPPFLGLTQTVEACDHYILNVVEPLLEIGPFEATQGNVGIAWWKMPVSLVVPVTKTSVVIDSYLSRGIATVSPIASVLGKLARRIARLGTANASAQHYELSAFCFGLANIIAALNRPSSALLLLHRALDLFFQSHAIEANILVETSDSLYFTDVGRQAQMVSLLSTERALREDGKLLGDRVRGEFLKSLNSMRNQLIYTHGGFGISRAYVQRALSEASAMVLRMEGNSRWATIAREFFVPPMLEEEMIFQIASDIDSFVEELETF